MTFSLLTVGNSVGYNNIRTHLTLADLRPRTRRYEDGRQAGNGKAGRQMQGTRTQKTDTLKQFHLHFSLRLDRGPRQDRVRTEVKLFPHRIRFYVTTL